MLGCGAAPPAPAAAPAPASAPASAPAPAPAPAPASAPASALASAPAPAPAPIPGDLPGDLDGALAARASCSKPRCEEPAFFPQGAAADARAPAATWSYDIAKKGGVVSFPKHAAVDLYGVCVKGEVTVAGAEKPGDGARLKAWGAFRAPGAGVTLAAAADGARVVLALVGGGEPIGDVVAKRGKDAAWAKRPAGIETADLAAARDLAWAGGAMHARIAFEGEQQRASLGVLLAAPDAPVAQHTHDGSWEILGVLRARGTMRRADAPGAQDMASIPVADGTALAVPKGALHAWEPGREKPLVAIQLYVPPGPEQRFKKLAEAAAAPK